MISESWPWKQELKRLLRTIRGEAPRLKFDDESDQYDARLFELERAIFYAAFVVRKLIENGKITDRVARHFVEVTAFKANDEYEFSMIGSLTATFDLDEYVLDRPHKLRLLITDLASEVIHSHRLVCSFGESGCAEGIYLSSYRNDQERIILVPLDLIVDVIDRVANDDVVSLRVEVEPHPTRPRRPIVKRTIE